MSICNTIVEWLIDLGPEGGDEGGEVVFTGTPADCALTEQSLTGRFLHRGNSHE